MTLTPAAIEAIATRTVQLWAAALRSPAPQYPMNTAPILPFIAHAVASTTPPATVPQSVVGVTGDRLDWERAIITRRELTPADVIAFLVQQCAEVCKLTGAKEASVNVILCASGPAQVTDNHSWWAVHAHGECAVDGDLEVAREKLITKLGKPAELAAERTGETRELRRLLNGRITQINDDVDPRYHQPTPKQRILAALRDLP